MEFDCLDVESIHGFDWDMGNIEKNKKKHGLDWWVIEEAFFNEPLVIREDSAHSDDQECRCYALGQSDDGTELFIAFTRREDRIRVISARPMGRKERGVYAGFKKEDS